MEKQAEGMGWGGRGWSCATVAACPQNPQTPGNSQTWLRDSFHPRLWIVPVPCPVLILFSALSAPLEPSPAGQGLPASLEPRGKSVRGDFQGWKKPPGPGTLQNPRGEGAESFPGAEPSHPHLSPPFDTDNLGSAAREPLGSGCNQRRERGMRGAERNGEGIPSWELLAAAGEGKDLEMSSRLRQLPAQRVPGAGSAPAAFPRNISMDFPLLAVG